MARDGDSAPTPGGGIPRMFTVPKESLRPTAFDPDFGLDSSWGQPQDPEWCKSLEEDANYILNRYGYDDLTYRDYSFDPNFVSSEVGDDEQTVSDSKAFIALACVFTQRLGMKVSWEDTSINPRFGNFAEDMIVLPDGYAQTYLHARNTNSYDDMSYLDIPKLRLAIDVRPMRMDHSSTNDGKASMVGSRQSWISKTNPLKASYEVFSIFQDVNLGLIRDKKFPYLPQSLGGHGKLDAFGNEANFARFAHAYKQGSHSLLIGNIVNRTVNYLQDRIGGRYPAKDPLLSHVVRFQSSFHDWVKGKSIYSPVTWIDVPPEVAKFSAGKLGKSPVMDQVLGRLLAERELLSTQQLQIAVEHNELCKALLKSESIPEFRKLRDEARLRFNNLSIFSLENYGMIKEITLFQDFKGLDISFSKIKEFRRLVKDARYNIRHLLADEDVYFPEAMESIYKTGPMSVQFNMFPLKKENGFGLGVQSREYSKDSEDTEEKSAVKDLLAWLRGKGSIEELPRTIINDDDAIIELCSHNRYNIIVTDDIKLCREAEKKTRSVILRKPVFWYYQEIYFGAESFKDCAARKYPGIEFVEHEDSGSIKSFEENHFFEGVMLEEHVRQPFGLFKSLGQRDKRRVNEIPFDATESVHWESLLFDFSNSLNARRKGTKAPRNRHDVRFKNAR